MAIQNQDRRHYPLLKTTALFAAILLLAASCTKEKWYGDYGIPYKTPVLYSVFELDSITDIRVEVSTDEWNKILAAYDADRLSEECAMCDIKFTQYGDTTFVPNAGIRIRGNTSRTRPEGREGRLHSKYSTDWHHCHFLVNSEKFQKGSTFNGVQKLALKFFNQDPTYVREIYGYDLFKKFGVWTAINDTYCRLTIRVKEDKKDAYYGIYGMCETIDKDYLRARAAQFGDSEGNLWKCYLGAGMENKSGLKYMMGLETNDENRKSYELKTNTANLEAAKVQFIDFIEKLNTLEGEEFRSWIESVTDIDLLLRTFAVTFVIGHWDDYWGNANNYYVYFNSKGKFFMIPYDLDNILGTSLWTGDAGRLDMMRWGTTKRCLYYKVLLIPEYKQKCIEYIHELNDPSKDLFHYDASLARISKWHEMIRPYVDNDTDEDTDIYDYGAPWSVTSFYKVYTPGPNNFFKVKGEHLPKLQQ